MPASRIPVDVDRLTRLTDLPTETAYALLGNPRMRYTLCALSRCEPQLPLDQLATAVARLDDDTSRSSARLSLVHTTLPKLEDYGVIEYQLRAEIVHLEGPVVALDDPLGARSERDDAESADRRGSRS